MTAVPRTPNVEPRFSWIVGADDELLVPDTYAFAIVAIPEPAGFCAVAVAMVFIAARKS